MDQKELADLEARIANNPYDYQSFLSIIDVLQGTPDVSKG